jgi:hypothetical protein
MSDNEDEEEEICQVTNFPTGEEKEKKQTVKY